MNAALTPRVGAAAGVVIPSYAAVGAVMEGHRRFLNTSMHLNNHWRFHAQ
jgi:hypothetical protein